MQDKAKEMTDKITTSANDYNEALCIIGEYVGITDEAGLEDEEEY